MQNKYRTIYIAPPAKNNKRHSPISKATDIVKTRLTIWGKRRG